MIVVIKLTIKKDNETFLLALGPHPLVFKDYSWFCSLRIIPVSPQGIIWSAKD